LSDEPTRTGLSADTLQRAVRDNLIYLLARFPEVATPHDWYLALAYSVRDRMLARWARRSKRISRET
jgi:glycogen phosphorylase